MRPYGPLRANNGDAILPSVLAGLGLAALPDFIVRDAIADGHFEIVLPDWSLPASALHWVTPPGGPRPVRVEALARFFAERMSARSGNVSDPLIQNKNRSPLRRHAGDAPHQKVRVDERQ